MRIFRPTVAIVCLPQPVYLFINHIAEVLYNFFETIALVKEKLASYCKFERQLLFLYMKCKYSIAYLSGLAYCLLSKTPCII